MYGLVNRAVEDLVRGQFGDDTWEAIRLKAGVENESDGFIAMQAYPDALTYALVGAASEVLNTPAADLLKAFGEHWILYTAKQGYSDMLKMAGGSLPVFLQNLDALHARVGLSFPALLPPSFRCTDVTSGSLRLHYYSTRQGLAPMVLGLINGLGKMFNTEVTVDHSARREEGSDHDEFVVRWSA